MATNLDSSMHGDGGGGPGAEPVATPQPDLAALLAEIAEDDAAWPETPWEPEFRSHPVTGNELARGSWRHEASDRGPAGAVDLAHTGHGAELSRYIARLRAREPQLVAALRAAMRDLDGERAETPSPAIRAVGLHACPECGTPSAVVACPSCGIRNAKRCPACRTQQGTAPIATDLEPMPARDPADVQRIETLEGIQRRLQSEATSWETKCDDARARVATLAAALRDLIARVEAVGGYASPDERDVLRRAKAALGGGAGKAAAEPGGAFIAPGGQHGEGLVDEHASGLVAAARTWAAADAELRIADEAVRAADAAIAAWSDSCRDAIRAEELMAAQDAALERRAPLRVAAKQALDVLKAAARAVPR